ncbi:MAG: PQQ-binding-like beta-propeller repeat protein [Mucilaginibacter sp.]
MNLRNNHKIPSRIWITVSGILLGLIAITIGCTMARKTMRNNPLEPYTTWTQYGGGADQSKYTELRQINKKNVTQLKVSWYYPTKDNIEYTFNPIVVDTIMYVLAKNNSLVALNATTGKEIWIHANLNGITRRGINYWESKDRKDRRLIFSLSNTLQEIDALTGKSILSFGTDGYISLKNDLARDPESISRAASSTPGHIFEDLIILGSAPGEALFSGPGHLRAYNVITGKLAWVFHTIPLPGEEGYETWPKDAYKYVGGVNTWGEISVDEKRGIAYFPLGSPTYDYYGADRIGANLFSDCILALDARTGKRLWHFQTTHHDLWDYDITAAPQLITVKHNGKMVDAVAVATKQGFLYVFDRVTGQPLWPIEERPVPPSNMPGEQAWPTQPFPTVIPPYNRQTVTVDDLNPFWDAAKTDSMKRRVAAAKSGLFTPLSDKYEVIAMPGATGGANLGNTASNPKKGIVYVASKDHASIYKLNKVVKPTSAPLSAAAASVAQTFYVENCQSCHGTNRQGGIGPALANIGGRITLDVFKNVVTNGKGQMPAFVHVDEGTMTSIYRFLGGIISQGPPANFGGRGFNTGRTTTPDGPVVASGGAPAAVAFNAQRPGKLMRAYPDGVPHPQDEYETAYGLANTDLVTPPWSTITAYDLNTGKIKWKKGLGQDARIPLKPGQENMGIPEGSQRKGMIVTSTGILFATSKGGMLYAFDADNGKLLWSFTLSKDTDGMMSTYEINGKQYIVVSAMGAYNIATKDHSKDPGAYPPGYMVFSLPDKKK